MKMRIVVLIALAMFLSIITLAQPYGPGHGCRNANPEMQNALRSEIFPLLKLQRIELDKSLTSAEKSDIARLRSELANLHEIHLQQVKTVRENNSRPTPEERIQLHQQRAQMEALMEEVALIADRHQKKIQSLLEEIKPEIENLSSEYCPAIPNCRGYQHRGGRVAGKDPDRPCMGYGNQQLAGLHLHRLLTPEGFLLFDPSVDPSSDEPAENEMIVSIFPNPASTSVQISVEIEKPSQLYIELLDRDGNMLKEINTKSASEGIYSGQFELNELPGGVYLIKVNTGNQSFVRQLIVKK